MTKVKRRTREEAKADTRKRLLAAAYRLFLSDGYGETSLDRIAEEAGLTKGAIYAHFESKAELFFALEAAGFGIGVSVSSNPGHDLSWPEVLDQMSRDLAGSEVDPRALALVMETFALALRHPDFRQRAAAALERQLAVNVEAFERDAWVPEGFPHARFVAGGYSATIGLVLLHSLAPELVTEEAFGDVLKGLAEYLGHQSLPRPTST